MGCAASKSVEPAEEAVEEDQAGPEERTSKFGTGSHLGASVRASGRRSSLREHLGATKLSVYSETGRYPKGRNATKINQDRALIAYPLRGSLSHIIMGVFDGHGSGGEDISQFSAFQLVDVLEEDCERLVADPTSSLCEGLRRVDEDADADEEIDSSVAGTTAIIASLHADQLAVACLGDSRCVKGRSTDGKNGKWEAQDLSEDQKPDLADERKRIEACEGQVFFDPLGNARVGNKSGLGLAMAMSRSIGDRDLRSSGVIAEAIVKRYTLSDMDRCIILASDGVFEFLSSQVVVDIAQSHAKSADAACRAIIEEASRAWKREEPGGYRDDISVIVAMLPLFPSNLPSQPAALKTSTRYDECEVLDAEMHRQKKDGSEAFLSSFVDASACTAAPAPEDDSFVVKPYTGPDDRPAPPQRRLTTMLMSEAKEDPDTEPA